MKIASMFFSLWSIHCFGVLIHKIQNSWPSDLVARSLKQGEMYNFIIACLASSLSCYAAVLAVADLLVDLCKTVNASTNNTAAALMNPSTLVAHATSMPLNNGTAKIENAAAKTHRKILQAATACSPSLVLLLAIKYSVAETNTRVPPQAKMPIATTGTIHASLRSIVQPNMSRPPVDRSVPSSAVHR